MSSKGYEFPIFFVWLPKIWFCFSIVSKSHVITSKKLIGNEKYLSWANYIELWFIGKGYENHLTTLEFLKMNVINNGKSTLNCVVS